MVFVCHLLLHRYSIRFLWAFSQATTLLIWGTDSDWTKINDRLWNPKHHETKGHCRVTPSCSILLASFLLLVHFSESVISYANLFIAWTTLGHVSSRHVGRGCKFSLYFVLSAWICLQVAIHIFHFHQISAICKLKCFQNVWGVTWVTFLGIWVSNVWWWKHSDNGYFPPHLTAKALSLTFLTFSLREDDLQWSVDS